MRLESASTSQRNLLGFTIPWSPCRPLMGPSPSKDSVGHTCPCSHLVDLLPSTRQDCALPLHFIHTHTKLYSHFPRFCLETCGLQLEPHTVITWRACQGPTCRGSNWTGPRCNLGVRTFISFSGDTNEQPRLRTVGFPPARDHSQPVPPFSLAQMEVCGKMSSRILMSLIMAELKLDSRFPDSHMPHGQDT